MWPKVDFNIDVSKYNKTHDQVVRYIYSCAYLDYTFHLN